MLVTEMADEVVAASKPFYMVPTTNDCAFVGPDCFWVVGKHMAFVILGP